MDEDSSGTDIEKLTKFSLSNALSQWLKLCPDSPELVKLNRYSFIHQWHPQDVDMCLNEIAYLILRSSSLVSQEFVQLFGTVLIELLERAKRMSRHQLMCILLGKLTTQNKAVLQYINSHFLFEETS